MNKSQNWTRENIAWLGGLFEGEGCISLNRQNKKSSRLILQIIMTDQDVIEKIYRIAGVGTVTGPYVRKSTERSHEKPVWCWKVARYEESQALLVAMYQFLGKRRKSKALECIREANIERIPARQYGNDTACGRGHSRIESSYRNIHNNWVCRECRRISERKRYMVKQ